MTTRYIQGPEAIVVTGIGTSETQITLSNFKTISGTLINQTMIGGVSDYIAMTLSPRTPREEQVLAKVNSVSGDNVILDIQRAVNPVSPYNVGGGVAQPHNVNDTAVISNNPALLNMLTAKDNAETITAQWSFPSPLNASSPATKQYADALSITGAPEASSTSRGLSKLSASPNTTIGVATVTIASPAVVSFTAHGLVVGDIVQFTTTGALPTGLLANTAYYVISAGFGADSFRLSLTPIGSAINTSGTQSGIHTLIRTTAIAVGLNDTLRLPSVQEKAAMAGGGNFGVPSNSNKFLTQEYNASATGMPVVRTYLTAGSPHTWTKPAGLKYVTVEVQAAGASGDKGGSTSTGGGGGGGGYGRKLLSASSLGASVTVTVGAGGVFSVSGFAAGGNSSFGAHITANGAVNNGGGTCTGGDINISGGDGAGGSGTSGSSGGVRQDFGGGSMLGLPGIGSSSSGSSAVGYGAGGGGGEDAGGNGGNGIVIVTEYYS